MRVLHPLGAAQAGAVELPGPQPHAHDGGGEQEDEQPDHARGEHGPPVVAGGAVRAAPVRTVCRFARAPTRAVLTQFRGVRAGRGSAHRLLRGDVRRPAVTAGRADPGRVGLDCGA
nr:hypothetical protein DA06_07930 [Georgenia sp. SUBG003]